MCEHLKINECSITHTLCPYTYFCNKTLSYKPLKSMPHDCKVKERLQIPKGYHKVLFERRGELYIQLEDKTIVVANPYDEMPLYVKLSKTKDGKWRVRK